MSPTDTLAPRTHRPAPGTTTTTPVGRLLSLARAELTLIGRAKGTLFAALFVPLVVPFTMKSAAQEMDLKGTGLSVGSVLLPSAIAFSLLFAVYSALVTVYAARREELVLKRLRTGEVRDTEILAGAALPSVAIGLVQCLVLIGMCAAMLDVGTPGAVHYVALGLVLGLVMFPLLAAVTSIVSQSVESAQVMVMPLLIASLIGSGATVPLEVMPDKLARICELLPLSPVIALIRGGWTGELDTGEALRALTIAVAWIAVGVFAVRKWFRWEPRR
ncbi:ABC transporter permease [Streptomyces flavofungini]|uniref:ABC transporter permease n=1 Tax=Streptomyces flavofungini TaxID=68200 RepID=UPI0025AFE5FE|nr:ABC transporter permease [Streptomyces flavofungini]WJV47721.1 ABC transporter permease [Streptomyces flavofungini]